MRYGRMTKLSAPFRQAIRLGLIAGVVSLSISAVGMAELFGKRQLISGLLTLGQVIVFLPTVLFAYMQLRKQDDLRAIPALLQGFILGVISALPLVLLVIVANTVNIREFFPNVSPASIDLLTFNLSTAPGSTLLIFILGLLGGLTAYLTTLPEKVQAPIFKAVLVVLTVGLFSEILADRARDLITLRFSRILFKGKALQVVFAIILFFATAGLEVFQGSRREATKLRQAAWSDQQAKRYRYGRIAIGAVALLVLPFFLGTYLSEVINNVGIFILMGLGLNIVVGFAGLLDLGYVAFFAIGSYTMAVLTTQGSLALGGLTFWQALPICVTLSALAGILLGIPVLRMRGDYLAIVTLGFGEIIRILALSDMLKSLIGGAQGVLRIPKPPFGNISLVQPEQFYYIVLAGCLLAWFVSWRLSESRLGRQWMAMREDEDVAEAMGIRLVTTKLLAFAFGAAFSGLAGALFASKLTSIFPHSFKLEISINVLALIIIGGIGSLPGVVVGAIILVGMPELLREFAEYRLLMYGMLLVVMMLAKPEGFIPSAIRKRELTEFDGEIEPGEAQLEPAGD
ncbi:MAG: leucine/isoleucine/valine transporter permease subunit [Anaerolineales bacterium]|nr:MAG: leucine/isoleucine/valine transporter permease subunit [Anaerolineales bacterium]